MKLRKLSKISYAGTATLILMGCGNVYLDDPSEGGTHHDDSGPGTRTDAGDARSPSNDGGEPFPDSSIPDSSPDVDPFDSPFPDVIEEPDAIAPGIPDGADDAAPPFDVDVPDSTPIWDGGSPVAIAIGQAPTSLALDDTNLYWQNTSAAPAIEYCPLTGCTGAPTVITESDNLGLNSFTVSQSLAYFYLGTSPSIYDEPISGGAEAPAFGFGYLAPIFSNSTNVFAGDLAAINSCPVGAPCLTPTTLYSVPSGSLSLVGISATEAFFLYTPEDVEDNAALEAVSFSGGTPRIVCASALFQEQSLFGYFGTAVITPDYVYFTSTASDMGFPGAAAIYRVPTAGGDPVIYAIDDSPYGLAADATNLYWTNSVATTGSVRACPLGAECTAPVTVAAGQDNPEPIVVNATTVYWGTSSAIYGAPTSL
jgi:hypothetical protein